MQKIVTFAVLFPALLIGSTVAFVGCGWIKESIPVGTKTDVSCPNCKGQGRYDTCPLCADKDSTARRACASCSGTGTLLCSFCNGRGTVPQDAIPRIETQMEVQRIGLEEEKRKKEQIEREKQEKEMRVLELAAQTEQARIASTERARIAAEETARVRIAAEEKARIAAEERAEKEREERRIAEEKEAERRRLAAQARQAAIAATKERWRKAYDAVEKGMDSSDVVDLITDLFAAENGVSMTGKSIMNSPPGLRNGDLVWQSGDKSRTITVKISSGKVSTKQQQGF